MRFLLLLFLCSIVYESASAQAPVPQSRQQALDEVESDLKHKKAEIKALEEKAAALKKQLKSTQSDLVDMAGKIKKQESKLSVIENRIFEYTKESQDIQSRLDRDRGSMGAMILAVERIRRVPPEALVLKPGAPYETAQTAMLLQSILPQIHNRSESYKADVNRLAELLEKLEAERKIALTEKQALEKDYADMETLVEKRKGMVAQSNSDYQQRSKEIKAISNQAASLKDLVAKLEEDKKRAQTRDTVRQAVYRQPETLPRAGQGQLPISGFIHTAFGQTDEIGAKSQGIKVEGRSGGLVVAPMAGKVQFAGIFKNYGELIIIEHEKGYHSLIAGLDRIDIVVEQVLNAGEPVGILPKAQGGEKPLLYFELRKNGKPINPAQKIANLKS
ncbi:MAG: peptidoglycan DD-metalloendopeptidase family protein [Pseudomonadota bacterium]